jgi:hypothetical protein
MQGADKMVMKQPERYYTFKELMIKVNELKPRIRALDDNVVDMGITVTPTIPHRFYIWIAMEGRDSIIEDKITKLMDGIPYKITSSSTHFEGGIGMLLEELLGETRDAEGQA